VQVDILIVNCSLFNPTPSLSAMLVNHFKMKSNIVSYNLSGMGCSAGVIAISLARELLQVRLPHSWDNSLAEGLNAVLHLLCLPCLAAGHACLDACHASGPP
jgi:hypothetical protein